jgi:hypothetical protein
MNIVGTKNNNNKFSGYTAHVVRNKRNFGSIKHTTEQTANVKKGWDKNMKENPHICIYKSSDSLMNDQSGGEKNSLSEIA